MLVGRLVWATVLLAVSVKRREPVLVPLAMASLAAGVMALLVVLATARVREGKAMPPPQVRVQVRGRVGPQVRVRKAWAQAWVRPLAWAAPQELALAAGGLARERAAAPREKDLEAWPAAAWVMVGGAQVPVGRARGTEKAL